MEITVSQRKFRFRLLRIGTAVALAFVALTVLFLAQVRAFRFVGGAYGCGAIDESIAKTEEGKTMIPMVPERASNGAVITKSMVIQGGWDYFGSESECATLGANPSVFGTQGLRDAGFVFTAPMTRSALTNDGLYPILTISPTVSQLVIEHMQFNNQEIVALLGGIPGYVDQGGAIYGTVDNGAMVRLTNVLVTDTVAGTGGGIYLELRGGSHLVIEDSEFVNNTAEGGGALNISVYDNSRVTIRNSRFEGNQAEQGGAVRLIFEQGSASLYNNQFINNSASGSGRAIYVGNPPGGTGEVYITNSRFSGNGGSAGSDVAVSGGGVTVYNLGETIFLPKLLNNFPPDGNYATITGITLNSDYDYVVEFETYGFTPVLPGTHLHFFFNTVAPEDAGVPGPGPWKIYGSTAAFTEYNDTDKPPFATHMCVLVANQNHTVQQNTGNCYRLPVNQ